MRSSLYHEFLKILGTNQIYKTEYHPKITDGIVERFNRYLKSSVKASENTQWTDKLPIVLRILTAVREDIKASCAELLYRTTLQCPSDMLETSVLPPCGNIFVDHLRNSM
ncbi:integrase catalytic domain-containing protein [Nephila pilipes]|uniref:Integrase catalytic domain-containing protein n=1 Tax=Nephila pilipes TaxID=299642 RepID=A0A8X6PUP2_NEPPI|nr:integrase catalytic domain-containing protein [Nephila pilipes]